MYSDLSRSGSEPDSLLDLYGRPRSHVDNAEQSKTADINEPLYLDDEDPESSRWIHRDKLALIESQEMRQAGIKLPQLPRSSSKSASKEDHSHQHIHEQYGNGVHPKDPVLYPIETEKTHSQRSSTRQEEHTQSAEPSFDIRTSAEIAQESNPVAISSPLYRQQGTRSSSSRIPLPKSSPLPIPQEHIERNTPLTRTRGASGNWSTGDEDGIGHVKGRSRSHSVGSQVLLDDGDYLTDSPNPVSHGGNSGSPSNSPTKRLGAKPGQVTSSGARKASNTLRNVSDPQRPRNASNPYRSSPNQRPKSRSGLESRPATAINRPEGDPPWLATMYKPDPRLPPDQQIIPTHAKRLQQEKEGTSEHETSGVFAPVGNHGEKTLQPPLAGPLDPQTNGKPNELDDEPGWPLRAIPSSTGNGSPDPAATTEQHAGYSTVPRVQNTPPISETAADAAAAGPQPVPESSTTEPHGKTEKAKRACGCCAVM